MANALFIPLLDPLLVSYAVNVVMVFGYLHYVIAVVNEICASLNIPCLTIPRKRAVE